MTLQFNSLESVLDAYDNRQVESWAIHQGKQFMFKGQGHDELLTILNSISKGGTNAIYTIKVFEDVDDVKKIKSNTPDDGSFNFRLNSDQMTLTTEQYTSVYSNRAIAEKLEALEKRLLEDEEIENEKNKSLGKIGDILEHPVIAPIVPILLEKIISTIFGNNNQNNQNNMLPAMAISGISDDEIIEDTIEKLKVFDPEVKNHLLKLLEMANNNNELFKIVINSL